MTGSGEIVVRAATTNDVNFLINGNANMALETENVSLDRLRLRDGVSAVIANPGHGFYLIGEIDKTPAGQMLVTYEWSDWRNGVFWWIQSVFVEEEFRRRGVFRALYDHVYQAAEQDPSVIGLRLYVDCENQIAMDTYLKMGMAETDYFVLEKYPL